MQSTIAIQTKSESAIGQIKSARTAGLPQGVVLIDAGYGNDTGLRTDITALGLRYVAGIGPNTSVWSPGEAPMPPQSRTGRGRPVCVGYGRPMLRRRRTRRGLHAAVKGCAGDGGTGGIGREQLR